MCFRANGQTLIREARLVPNCCSEFCWWFSTCLWSVAFPLERHGCKHRTNAVWLTQDAFGRRRLRIRRLRSMSFYLSMASYLPDFCADGSTYAEFGRNTTGYATSERVTKSQQSKSALSVGRFSPYLG